MRRPLATILLILLYSYTLILSPVSAEEVLPIPQNSPCDKLNPEEFHPLRPYPLNPCDKHIPEKELTFACGQSLVPQGQVSLSRTGPACADDPSKICLPKQSLTYNLSIDLKDAKVPFLGNTENRDLSDAAKANEYLSWYLNGTVFQSEQKPLDTKSQSDIDRVINYSGPVKKLLPYDAQQEVRRTLALGPIGQNNNPQSYHNYLVGCQRDIDFEYIKSNFIKPIQDANTYITAVATALAQYAWDNISNPGKFYAAIEHISTYLKDLDGIKFTNALPDSTTLVNAVFTAAEYANAALKTYINLINTYSINLPESCTTSNDKVRLLELANHLPPDPKTFSSQSEYSKKLTEWYEFITIFGFIVDHTPGVWASLFQNIPFSSLEDVAGEITIGLNTAGNPQGPNDPDNITLTITNPSFPGQPDSRVYIPHVRNIDTLSQLLTSTFRSKSVPTPLPTVSTTDIGLLSKDLGRQPDPDFNPLDPFNNSSIVSNQSPPQVIADPEVEGLCNVSQVRVHDGDSITGKTITATLRYDQVFRYDRPRPGKGAGESCAQSSECASNVCEEQINPPLGKIKVCTAPPSPIATTSTKISTYSKIPLIGKIYDTLVGGPQSLAKRFFPASLGKCEGPNYCTTSQTEISCTNQASSGCTWIPDDLTIKSKKDKAVPATSGTGSNVTASSNLVSASTGQASGIYFPYLGSLADYILGIPSFEKYNLQKALRPKGLVSAVTSSSGSSGSQNPTPIGPPPEGSWCAETQLDDYFPASDVAAASCICQRESKGGLDAAITNKSCTQTGGTLDYSVGLFQINLLVHPDPANGFYATPAGINLIEHLTDRGLGGKFCHQAFTYSGNSCTVLNNDLANACETWFANPYNNMTYANHLFSKSGWSPWSTAGLCGL